jgi:hypothetical protein
MCVLPEINFPALRFLSGPSETVSAIGGELSQICGDLRFDRLFDSCRCKLGIGGDGISLMFVVRLA